MMSADPGVLSAIVTVMQQESSVPLEQVFLKLGECVPSKTEEPQREFSMSEDIVRVKEECLEESSEVEREEYVTHEIKCELELGPETLQPPDSIYLPEGSLKKALIDTIKQEQETTKGLEMIKNKKRKTKNSGSCTARKAYSCDKCGKKFKVKKSISLHLLNTCKMVIKKETFTCNICRKEFPKKRHLLNHQRWHTMKKLHCCEICNKQCATEYCLKIHLRLHARIKYTCEFCGKMFNYDYKYFRHKRIHTGEKPYICDICKKQFTQKSHVKNHILTRHIRELATKSNDYKCDVCNDHYVSELAFQRHLKFHVNYVKPLVAALNVNVPQISALSACRKVSNALSAWTSVDVRGGERVKREKNKGYTCEFCNKHFPYMERFLRHKRSHTGEKPFTCPVCKKPFSQKVHLKSHLHTQHDVQTQDIQIQDIQICDTNIKPRFDRIKPFTCDICNKQCLTKYTLTKHLQKHVTNKHTCEICNKPFKRKEAFLRHRRMHTGEKPYTCDFCYRPFSQKIHLSNHIRTQHTPDSSGPNKKPNTTVVKPYACDLCERKFSAKYTLVSHMRTHTGVKPFTCEFCSKQFAQKFSLIKHKQMHTKENLLTCDICNKQFSLKFSFTRHKLTHTGEKPFACKLCDKPFREKSSAKQHERLHEEKPYACKICKMLFSEISSLDAHTEAWHTGKELYTCKICNKQFSQRANLWTHTRIHTGYKPYNCSICNKEFSFKACLDRHLRVHTGETFACPFCNKQLKTKASLKKHKRMFCKAQVNQITVQDLCEVDIQVHNQSN